LNSWLSHSHRGFSPVLSGAVEMETGFLRSPKLIHRAKAAV
jgi:hypothetical protein